MDEPHRELMEFASNLSDSDIDPEAKDTLLSKIRDLPQCCKGLAHQSECRCEQERKAAGHPPYLRAPPKPSHDAMALLDYLDIFLQPNPKVDLSGLVCKHGLALEACPARECNSPMAYETAIKRARDYIAALSPSPAVAAEPVALTAQFVGEELLRWSKIEVALRRRFPELNVESKIDAWPDLISALATPTVGGDRQAIARCLVNNDPNYCCNHMPGDEPREVKYSSGWVSETCPLSEAEAEKVRIRADAILSLPVQPGAGEREALARTIRAAYEKQLATVNGDATFEYAAADALLARQAPHSSSEGGR